MESDYQQMPQVPQVPSDGQEYYGQTHRPQFGQPAKKSHKKLFIILGVIVALVVIGGGVAAFLLLKKDSTKSQTTTSSQSTNQPSKSAQPTGAQKVGSNYLYKSTKLNIAVTYPQTWTMRETSDKQEIILTSPKTTYVKKGGTSTEGVFTIKLRNGIIPDGIKTTVQNSVAVANSEVIAYSKPTTDQREYTNLSYLGPDANNFSYLLVTGYTEYKAGQSVGGGIDLNGQAYMFAGGYGADSADTLAFDPVPKADYDSTVLQQAIKIFESIQLY